MNSQLPSELNLEVAANNLVANREQLFRITVEIALIEHEQVAALVNQPLELVDELRFGANAPVEALGAERTARPAATPARDDWGQLITVVVLVKR